MLNNLRGLMKIFKSPLFSHLSLFEKSLSQVSNISQHFSAFFPIYIFIECSTNIYGGPTYIRPSSGCLINIREGSKDHYISRSSHHFADNQE